MREAYPMQHLDSFEQLGSDELLELAVDGNMSRSELQRYKNPRTDYGKLHNVYQGFAAVHTLTERWIANDSEYIDPESRREQLHQQLFRIATTDESSQMLMMYEPETFQRAKSNDENSEASPVQLPPTEPKPPKMPENTVSNVMKLLLDNMDDPTAFQQYGNCTSVDPDVFFPEKGGSTKEAKFICKGCVVREECLEYALNNGEKFGVWGGTSERERRRIRRARARADRN